MPGNTALSLQEEIWQWVASVPAGRVASYGQIAALAGYPQHARYVGSTLRKLPQGTALPWHRILRGNGSLAFPPGSPARQEQADRLSAEGVPLISGRVCMSQYQWQP